MHADVNGARLWFDVEGASLVPDGSGMRERPTVVLVHGGPGGYDHSYFKPYFAHLTGVAQVVYLDLRDHGRSTRHDPEGWSFELCADDVRTFCDVVGIGSPVVLGHSMGGFIAMLYGARHPGHARALVLQSTMARFDMERLVDGFRRAAGEEVAELAGRDYAGDPVTDQEWAKVFAAFGPQVPSSEQLARRVRNLELAQPVMELLRRLDVTDRLSDVTCPSLVCVGELDPITPVAAAREIMDGLRPGVRHLEVIPRAGHFPWLDHPAHYWGAIEAFVTTTAHQEGD